MNVNVEIKIDEAEFEEVKCFKYCILYFDPRLNFFHQIEQACAKAKFKLSTLQRCGQCISQDISLLLYKLLLLPVLVYGDIVHSSANAT